jgi:hypothetical protein
MARGHSALTSAALRSIPSPSRAPGSPIRKTAQPTMSVKMAPLADVAALPGQLAGGIANPSARLASYTNNGPLWKGSIYASKPGYQ